MSDISNALRELNIRAMTRQGLLEFIKRKDNFYSSMNFEDYSDELLRYIATIIDRSVQYDKYEQKNTK